MTRKAKETNQSPLTREQILSRCQTLPEQAVFVPAMRGHVLMQNVTFAEMVSLQENAPDKDTYKAMLMASVCKELSLEDAIKLQRGNGAAYAALYLAVEGYLNADFSDDAIKK